MLKNYKVGDIIKTQVTGITKYGIFVSVDPWYDGLIHISEISQRFVKDINEYVKLGEIIYCRILEVDDTNFKLKLSIKDINYKNTVDEGSLQETRKGFLPLKENLDIWINEALNK